MSDAKRGAPLRKIVETIIFNHDLFSNNLVLLECGHKAYSNSMYRTRCLKCKKEAQEKPSLDVTVIDDREDADDYVRLSFRD